MINGFISKNEIWLDYNPCFNALTLWGRVTHICVDKITIIGSDNGLLPGRHQAIIWIKYGILLLTHLETNCNEIPIKIHTFSFKKIHLKMSSGKGRPFCLGLNVLINCVLLHAGYVATRTSPWAENLFYLTVELLSFKKEKRLRLRHVAVQSSLYKKLFLCRFHVCRFFRILSLYYIQRLFQYMCMFLIYR